MKLRAHCMIAILIGAAGLVCSGTVQSADNAEQWSHWRGPLGNGVAPGAQPPTEFGLDKNLKWKVEIPGKGSGSPVVWENKIFVQTAVSSDAAASSQSDLSQGGSGGAQRRQPAGASAGQQRGRGGSRRGGGAPLTEHKFNLLCVDRDSGEILWERTATTATPHQATHRTNSHASASPCTDGQHVYAHFGSRGLYCYDLDGNLQWSRNDLGKMETRNAFGEGSSPTIAGDFLIVPWDHEGPSALYALNKLTGKTVWKTDRDEPTCWATPLIVDAPQGKQIIMNGQNYARAYDLDSGKEVWRCSGQTDRPAASAVSADGVVYIGSGYRGSFIGAFQLDGTGDIQNTQHVLWSKQRDTPDIASPLLSDGRLYYFKARDGILSCVDAQTGQPLYPPQRIRNLGEIYASPVAAGGHVYLSDREGHVVVIRDADTFELVATNELGETIDASPAPIGNELIVRGEKHLFCFSR